MSLTKTAIMGGLAIIGAAHLVSAVTTFFALPPALGFALGIATGIGVGYSLVGEALIRARRQ